MAIVCDVTSLMISFICRYSAVIDDFVSVCEPLAVQRMHLAKQMIVFRRWLLDYYFEKPFAIGSCSEEWAVAVSVFTVVDRELALVLPFMLQSTFVQHTYHYICRLNILI